MRKEWKVTKKYSYLAFIAIAVSFFVACEDDFSEVGSNLVDNNNFNALLFDSSTLDAYSVKITGAQTNNFEDLLLGVYNDPNYGMLTSNVVSQLSLSTANPNFGVNPTIDSVVLNIPYYSTAISIQGDTTTYKLDSIYGESPINLSVYRNNYYISNLDPDNDYQAQEYYTDQFNTFDQNYDSQDPLLNVSNFTPSAEEVRTLVYNETESDEDDDVFDLTKSSPSFRFLLDNDYFQDIIFDREGSSELISNANFQNYFRGLYFKSESINEDGNMSLLNFSQGNITIFYTDTYTTIEEDENGDETEVTNVDREEFVLNFSENFNVFDSEYDEVPNQEKLYLKGGDASMAVIDIFTDQNQLDSIRDLGWLVNEANLTFYVDEQVEDTDAQPNRLYLYDINNNTALIDYIDSYDFTGNEANPSISKVIHLGPLSTDDDGNRYYKFRVTGLVNNIINNDSTNTRLGLAVSSNVNQTASTKATFSSNAPENLENIPRTSILSPRGTILNGANTSGSNSSNRLKLNIFYTQPE